MRTVSAVAEKAPTIGATASSCTSSALCGGAPAAYSAPATCGLSSR